MQSFVSKFTKDDKYEIIIRTILEGYDMKLLQKEIDEIEYVTKNRKKLLLGTNKIFVALKDGESKESKSIVVDKGKDRLKGNQTIVSRTRFSKPIPHYIRSKKWHLLIHQVP